ncbi:unnamed protein product [Dibothriocephalus latus]|uniref:PAS domain-containing protein n=1 Tax=Dibothriocephalus latus TaxID=60516 RepID=A0A3P6TMQ6_DIBLA|nr:unnamed protein product [Dibothriocephalus latus]
MGHDHPIMEHRLVSHLYHCPIDITEVEGEASLHALNGFIFIVSCDGEVFSVCKTVEHYLGFHQSDILHQSVMELIHSEDREEFQRQLSWQAMLPGEHRNLTLQEVISPGENANQRYLLQKELPACLTLTVTCSSDASPSAFDAYWTTLPASSLDGSQREASFKTKHTLDLTITSMDSRAQTLFYFSGKENSKVKIYDLIHPDDLQYVAKGHSEVCETGSIGLLAHRWLSKNGNWIWLQSRLKVVYKNNKQDRIIAIHRKLDDSEGNELYYRRNSEYKLPFPLLEPETLLSEDDASDFCTDTTVEGSNGATATGPASTQQEQHSPDSSKASTYKEIKSLYLDDIQETATINSTHEVTEANRRKLWEDFPISASQKEASETAARLTTGPKIDSTTNNTRNGGGGLGSGGNTHRRFRNQLKNYLQTTRRRKPQLKSATANKAGRPVPPYGVRGTKQAGDSDNGSANNNNNSSWYAYRNLLTRNPALGFFGVPRSSSRNPPAVQTADSRLSEYSFFQQTYASSCGYPNQLVRGYEAGQTSPRVWDLETHGGLRRKREADFDLSAEVMSAMTADQQALGYSAAHPQYNPLIHGMNGDYSSAYEAYSAAVAAAAVVAAASGQNQQEYGCPGSVTQSPDSETLQNERLYEGATRCRLSSSSSPASANSSASVTGAVPEQTIDAENEALRLFKVNGRSSQPWFSHLGSFAANSGHGENEQGLYTNFSGSTSDSTTRDASCYIPELSNHNIYNESLLPWTHFENRQTICIDDASLCDASRYQLGFTATT